MVAVEKLNTLEPYGLAALRIMSGLLFVQGGTQKLFGFPPPLYDMPMDALMIVAGLLELIGGALITVGLLTRPAAFVLSGMMAVGYFMVHAPQDFFPANNMGTPAILFCFVFLYFVFSGPGAWSLDRSRALPWR